MVSSASWVAGLANRGRNDPVHKSPIGYESENSMFLMFPVDGRECSHNISIMNGSIALYQRVSTEGQKLDSQDVELRRYCRQRGWKNLAAYADKISGTSAGRPGLDKLLEDVRRGKVERVVIYALDRLGRSLSNLCLVLDQFKRHSVGLVVTSQGIDTSTNDAAANLQLNVLSAVCVFEREMIVQRVNAGLQAAKARGVRLGRPPTLNDRTAEVLRLKKARMGIRAIARELAMPPSSVFKILNPKNLRRQKNISPSRGRIVAVAR